MNPTDTEIATDLCYRCGYDLRATPDDRPCPECGLLAARSRRPSDELRHSRPNWLRGLAGGAVIIMVSIGLGIAWWPIAMMIDDLRGWNYFPQYDRLPMWGAMAIALLFFVGIFLLSRREGYPPADRADHRLRFWLRLAALVPVLATALAIAAAEIRIREISHFQRYIGSGRNMGTSYWVHPAYFYFMFDTLWQISWIASFFLLTIGTAPLPLLLFRHLRGLAKRARSAHLAEHCTIVGIGLAASLIYVAGAIELFENASWLGLPDHWLDRSYSALALMAILGVAAFLFVFWSIHLLLRFTISFVIAAHAIRRA